MFHYLYTWMIILLLVGRNKNHGDIATREATWRYPSPHFVCLSWCLIIQGTPPLPLTRTKKTPSPLGMVVLARPLTLHPNLHPPIASHWPLARRPPVRSSPWGFAARRHAAPDVAAPTPRWDPFQWSDRRGWYLEGLGRAVWALGKHPQWVYITKGSL